MDTLSAAAIDETKLFRREGIQFFIKEHMERRANLGYHLWGLLILFLWIRHWNIQTASAPILAEESVAKAFTRA
jgi:asparagine synthase (glutamine-hydrolysing)